MAVTTFKGPGTAALLSGGPTCYFPNNAKTNDGAATITSSASSTNAAIIRNGYASKATASQVLRVSNFGFTTSDIPSDATINGIEVNIWARRNDTTATNTADSVPIGTATTAVDAVVKLAVISAGTTADEIGSNLASATNWDTVYGSRTYGGSTNLWGASLTPAQLTSSTFAIDYQLSGSGATGTAGNQQSAILVDYVEMRVYYTASGGGGTSYTLTAAKGSYALTGVAATLNSTRALTAAAGSYSQTGYDATLTQATPAAYTLTADVGAYSQTGFDATLTSARAIAAAVGSYALIGNAANLASARSVAAGVGSYALTGYDATLTYAVGAVAYSLTADVGSYALTGSDAAFPLGRSLAGSAGSFAVTGYDAALASARSLTGPAGSYALTGFDAVLLRGYALTASVGSYSLTGQAAALLSARSLAGAAGSYALTGLDAGLTSSRSLTAGQGAYTFSGVNAGLTVAYGMGAATGSYSLTGVDAALTKQSLGAFVLTGIAGSYALAGQDATLTAQIAVHYTLPADAGAYALSGSATTLIPAGPSFAAPDQPIVIDGRKRDRARKQFEARQDADKAALRAIVERAFADEEAQEPQGPDAEPDADDAPAMRAALAEKVLAEADIAGLSASLAEIMRLIVEHEQAEARRRDDDEALLLLMVA